MKTTHSTLLGMMIAVIFIAAPVMTFAQATFVPDTSLMNNLREKQISNREKIKNNLLRILATPESPLVDTTTEIPATFSAETAPAYTTRDLASITYRLADITDRLESRMMMLEYQGQKVPTSVRTSLVDIRMHLEKVTTILGNDETTPVNTSEIITTLIQVKTSLSETIASLKTTLTETN